MLMRGLAGAALALLLGAAVLAEETRGTITKISDDSITIRTGRGRAKGGEDAKREEKTFKIPNDVKIVRRGGKDKEVKITLDELKTAVKVTNVSVTVTHDGNSDSEIKIGGIGGRGGTGKDKKKEDDD